MYIYYEGYYDLPENAEYIGDISIYVVRNGMPTWKNLRNEIFLRLSMNGANLLLINENEDKSSKAFVEGKMYRIENYENSAYTEESLKLEWSTRNIDSIEGIYYIDMGYVEDKYTETLAKFAVVKTDDSSYKMVYLYGFESINPTSGLLDYKTSWKKGDVLANIKKTENNRLFTAEAFQLNRYFSENCMLSLEDKNIRLYFSKYARIFVREFPQQAKYESFQGSLTGFAINKQNIVTCYHGVESSEFSIYIKGIDGNFNTRHEAEIVKFDKNKDIAILKLKDSTKSISFLNLSFTFDEKETADEVFVLGYPISLVMGEEIKLTTGIINSKSGLSGNTNSYQFSAPIQEGNSGSPLFDKSGNVIGLVTSGVTNTDNVGYALKIKHLNDFLTKNKIEIKSVDVDAYSEKSMKEKVTILKPSIYLIEIISHKKPLKKNGNNN